MKKLKRREKRILTLGGILGGMILLVFYGILPLYEAQASVKEDVRNKQRLLRRALQSVQEQENYHAQLESMDAVLGQYREQLLDTRNAANQLMEIFDTLAAQNNVRVTRKNPTEHRNVGDRYAKISLNANIEGDMTDVANFLYALSSYQKYLVVDEFQVTAFRMQNQIRIQPRINVSGFIRLS
jgi:Tfp pilus assembly protein PilO